MCFHNSTQHNGCGHIGEAHTQPWTLCEIALRRLSDLRGPNSPLLSLPPPRDVPPPKRSSSTRRFLSLSNTLSRSATTSSVASRRTNPGPTVRPSRASISGFDPLDPPTSLDYATLPDHQLLAVRCAVPVNRTRVTRDMDVCKSCKRWIVDMRHMVERYEKTGSIRGTSAFEEFLNVRKEVSGVVPLRGGASFEDAPGRVEGDLTVPLRDSVMGIDIGARQAIVLGYPEEEFERGFSGGLEGFERSVGERRRGRW
ncbi:hypothetical protein P153DRAFT_375740 [Dothidotthia symphoricarpi CBS 119687]|uniref:Uncharacterized protein n=1 Tax=Dothidotthia symphoricarpi CBS 119687 TaxID=1392245 RepID=A0A6A6AFM4_9PLEO|nr:uncharacterized protein P153DRAFT_375740 [Dothidotthia symphoricarpi CBS 119687]KAF2129201.1 hypothetical protein P153DRAFT_375740 [Dothidotthia symphoricarpi CBS 119687]